MKKNCKKSESKSERNNVNKNDLQTLRLERKEGW